MENLKKGNKYMHDDADINLQKYVGLFISNWYWFTLSLLFAGMLAYGINNYSEKVYTVSSSLLIKDDQNTSITGLEKVVPVTDIFKSQQNLQNEIGILKSFYLNYKVITSLPEFQVTIVGIGRKGIAQYRHYRSAPFEVVYDTITDQICNLKLNLRIKSAEEFSLDINGDVFSKEKFKFGELVNEKGFRFKIIKRDTSRFNFDPALSNRYSFWFNKPEALANEYRSKLHIEPVNEDASLLTLSVSGVSNVQEAEYLNKLMDVYIDDGLYQKNLTASRTIEFINKQLSTISDSLKQTEQKMESFKQANKMLDITTEGAAIKNKLDQFLKEKSEIYLKSKYLEYLSDYVKNKKETEDIISPSTMGINDDLLIGLVGELAKLQNQKKQLKYSYSDSQPVFELINSKLEDCRKSISENIKNNQESVNIAISEIDSRIKSVEIDLNKLPEKERNLINIQRNFDLNNTVYTYMLEKRSEASIAKASKVSDNRIIDHANGYNTVLIKPKTRKNYMFAIIFGLLLPSIYILMVDQLHNKILDKKDIEKYTEVPIIGFVGHNSIKSELPVKFKPSSSLSESFRTIRTNLKYYLNGREKAVISVTSTISGEGKTFISLNLGGVLAMLGKKTLLIGVDLRKPRLDKIFNYQNEIGLSSFLIGEGTLNEIIRNTEIENLYYIPSGSIPPNPSELLESEKMKTLLDKLKADYDFIILDTPPVGIVSDAMLFGPYADINIFVIRQRYSFKNTLELIQSIYEKDELKNLTIAINDINLTGYYGYGLRYGYGFYQGYGYNYGYRQYGSYGYNYDYSKYYTED